MNLPSLYEIANEYRDGLEKLGDLDLPAEAVADTLAALQGTLELKAKNVAAFVQNLEALAASIKEAESKMAHRRKVLENRANSIRQYIKDCMESAGVSKIECPYFKLQIKKSPPSVIIEDEAQLPPEFLRVPELPPPAPDKKAIAEKLKAGDTVPGARLQQGTRLDIS